MKFLHILNLSLCLIFHISDFHNMKIVNNTFFRVVLYFCLGVYMHEEDFALNNLQWLICHKTRPKPTGLYAWHYLNKNNLSLIYILKQISMSEQSGKLCVRPTETLNSGFDFIRSHQQYILWSPRLATEPVTTEWKAETLPLSHWSTSRASVAKLTRILSSLPIIVLVLGWNWEMNLPKLSRELSDLSKVIIRGCLHV